MMKSILTIIITCSFLTLLEAQTKDIFIVDFHNDKDYNSIIGKNIANEFERALGLCKSKYRVIPRIKYQRQIEGQTFEMTKRFLNSEGIDYIIYGRISKDDISKQFVIEYIFEEVNTHSIVLIENIYFKEISKLLNSNNRYKTIQSKLSNDDELCRKLSKDDIPTIIDEDAIAKETEEQDGMITDSDADGIPNSVDKEPNTPMGAKVDERGVEIKNIDNGWTSIEKQAILKMLPDLPNIPFEFGKAEINEDAYMMLDQMARLMKMYPIIIVKLEGMDTNDKTLAANRAKVTKEYLVSNYKLPEKRFTTTSKTDLAAQDEVVSTIALDQMDF
jgi:outer membrane protein OmpA-like peptidoglycan-associated protein